MSADLMKRLNEKHYKAAWDYRCVTGYEGNTENIVTIYGEALEELKRNERDYLELSDARDVLLRKQAELADRANRAEWKLGRAEAILEALALAAVPIDAWLGHLRQDLSQEERKEFADALCAALLLAQGASTTSEQQQTPASPGGSAPSSRSEFEGP